MKNLPTLLVSTALLVACSNPGGSTPVAQSGYGAGVPRSFKIYVSNIGSGAITTHKANGAETTPTIQTGSGSTDYLFAMTVGSDGKSMH